MDIVLQKFSRSSRGQEFDPKGEHDVIKGNLDGNTAGSIFSRITAGRTSRRRFIGGAAAAAALTLGPGYLSACDSHGGTSGSATDQGGPAGGTLRITNWPLSMADGFVAAFQQATGVTVDYMEDFEGNNSWLGKVQQQLERKHDIGADLVVPEIFLAARLGEYGWLNEISKTVVPNWKNLESEFVDLTADSESMRIAPYLSGMVGIAYNRAVTRREIRTVDDLWDPAFRGRVGLLAEMRDSLGMLMMSQGHSPENPSMQTVQQAIDLVREQNTRGQIRVVTGGGYIDDLAAGDVIVTQAYSGDIIQLQADNPDLEFVVPDSGTSRFVDTMVIPYTTRNQKAAETWINFVYDRANYAKLINFTKYVPVLSDMTEELHKLDPEAASNPWINPPREIRDRVKSWAFLNYRQTMDFETAFNAVVG